MYILSVMVEVNAESVKEFKELALRHADNTKKNESGCLAFDVYKSPTEATKFYFQESYKDQAAVDEVHSKAPYFHEFLEKTKAMILNIDIKAWVKA